MRFNVFGKYVEVINRDSKWKVFYLGEEGKKRPAQDILIPDDISESQLIKYLSDLCHESASPRNNKVERVE